MKGKTHLIIIRRKGMTYLVTFCMFRKLECSFNMWF